MDQCVNNRDMLNRTKIDNMLFRYGNQSVAKKIFFGLNQIPKYISSTFFYDEKGSKIFRAITQLSEYYLTRIEKRLLENVTANIAPSLRGTDIIELGSGDCTKIAILLNGVPETDHESIKYVPVDVSETAVEETVNILSERYPLVSIHGIVLDFMEQFHLIPSGSRNLFCFFGSTLGNFSHGEAKRFIVNVSNRMKTNDRFLLGVDMVKSKDVLEEAYNDASRVTANFNRNILNVVNDLTGTNFNPNAFDHMAFFNESAFRIEMHLRALQDMVITCPFFPRDILLKTGETIHTENSYKFHKKTLEYLAESSGLRIENWTWDENQWFSLIQLVKR